jgi:hypothetical protein
LIAILVSLPHPLQSVPSRLRSVASGLYRTTASSFTPLSSLWRGAGGEVEYSIHKEGDVLS